MSANELTPHYCLWGCPLRERGSMDHVYELNGVNYPKSESFTTKSSYSAGDGPDGQGPNRKPRVDEYAFWLLDPDPTALDCQAFRMRVCSHPRMRNA